MCGEWGQVNLTNQILYKVYDSGGTLRTYTVNYGSISLSTNFNQSGPYGPIQEVSLSRSAITSIVLPDGRSYAFQYETNSYGGLTRIDLPSGAYVTYTWGTAAASEKTFRYVTSRTLHVDGQSYEWTFSRAPGSTGVTVTDPLGNQSVYTILEGTVLTAKVYAGAADLHPSFRT
ncbi:MAG: hypothetical protein L0191_09690 [Acidobacteria bacterium]|nr:hypothetical protein [Acidobacteriota bacterium]